MRSLRVPGDKSIAHRALILATLAPGSSRLQGLPVSADIASTARCLGALGARVTEPPLAFATGCRAHRHGVGEEEWTAVLEGPARLGEPPAALECGNSGTTARLLAGLLVGLGIPATLDGDASLRTRPMDRVAYPLQALGGKLRYLERPGRLPLRIEGRATGLLRPLRHRSRVASAQVKSALLLAGLAGGVRVEVIEPGRSRDHTERLLGAMGAPISFGPEGPGANARLEPTDETRLSPLDFRLPGDPSSAAFLFAAALLAGRRLRVEAMSANPTRTGFLEVLEEMGVEVRVDVRGEVAGEPVADVEVRPTELRPFSIGPELVPRLLDEIPVLAVLAARAAGTSRLRGAEELRVKESDRLAALAANLEALGVRCEQQEDGLAVQGTAAPLRGAVRSQGDHRIAMAFGALSADPGALIEIEDAGCAAVSYPAFWERLREVTG